MCLKIVSEVSEEYVQYESEEVLFSRLLEDVIGGPCFLEC